MTMKKRTASLLASVVAVSTLSGNVCMANAQTDDSLVKEDQVTACATDEALKIEKAADITKERKTTLWEMGDAAFNQILENSRTTIQGIVIDTKAEGAKFNAEGRSNAILAAGTIIEVPVEKASTIEIKHGYDKGNLIVKDPDGNVITTIAPTSTWATTAFAYEGNKNGYITLEVKNKEFYIETIKVKEAPTTPMTYTVGANGTYKEVQEALDAIDYVPTEGTRATLKIEPGTYIEEVKVTKPYVTFENTDPTKEVKITYDKASGHDSDKSKDKGTQDSGSVTIEATANNFKANYITFENSYNLYQEDLGDTGRKQTQAVAVVTFADRIIFEACNFIGRQDTLYLKGSSNGQNTKGAVDRRVYLKDCYIEGTVDFIFGDSTAFFENCDIKMKYYSNGGYFTAANTNLEKIGFVFENCNFEVDEAYNKYIDVTTGKLTKNIRLGRPWQGDHTYPYFGSHTALINCNVSPLIIEEGWTIWDQGTVTNKVRFMEYGSRYADGTAVDLSKRLDWVHILDANQASAYNGENVLRGSDNWNPTNKQLSSTIQVADITLNSYKLSIPQGETEQIIATVLPMTADQKGYTWRSLSSDIVSVDSDGTVHALAGGAGIVEAISNDNDCKVKAEVKVLPTRTALPKVKEISIKANDKILPGDIIEGVYTYENELDIPIDVAKVQWYVVDPKTGDEILVQEGKEDFNRKYKVTSGDIGSQLKFVVLPETQTTYGVAGTPVSSSLSGAVLAPDYKVPELYVREPFKSFLANYTNVKSLEDKVNTKWYGALVSRLTSEETALSLMAKEGRKGASTTAWKVIDSDGVPITDPAYNGNNTIAGNISYQSNSAVLVYNAEEVWTNYVAEARVRFSPTATGFSAASYWDMYIDYNPNTHSGYRLNMRRGADTKSAIFTLYRVKNGVETQIAEDKTTFAGNFKQASATENPFFRVNIENRFGKISAKVYIERQEDTMVNLSFEDAAPLAGTVAFETYGKTGCPVVDMLTVEEILSEESSKPEIPSGVTGGGSTGHISTVNNSNKKSNDGVIKASQENNKVNDLATSSGIKVSFTDIKKYSWAEEAINKLAEKGIVQGQAQGKFNPAAKVKRADSVIMLIRLLDAVKGGVIDDFGYKENFSDCPSTSYYRDYLAYAKANELVKGTGNNTFAPNASISRQDMMVMMVNALEKMEMLDTSEADLSVLAKYGDEMQISDYAKPAVAVIIQKGIITGTNKGIEPKSVMTRAQSAVMMYRFMELFAQ